MKKKLYDNKGLPLCLKKMLLIMRLSLILVILFSFTVNASVFSQRTVTLKVHSEFLSKVLIKIKDQTDVSIVFNEDMIKDVKCTSHKFKNTSVKDALDLLLLDTKFYIQKIDGVFVIRKRIISQQKKYIVNGIVVDKKGESLPGVTVLIKGTVIGVTTNSNGEFTISVINKPNTTLQFSFIGMKTIEKILKFDDKLLKVVLNEDVKEIDEVVVTGIFERKSESYTDSAVTIKGDELKKVGNLNIFQSLKNLDPSLMNIDNLDFGSDPNRMPELQLRGTSSFPGSMSMSELKGNYKGRPNQPLFILDGFPVSVEKVFDMDMDRVQSLTILKDAAAKAIYGSRAANGVVVIETKTIISEELRIYYSGSLNLSIPDLTSYNLCNAEEKLEVEKIDGFYSSSFMPDLIKKQNIYNQRLHDVKEGLDTYWLSKPLRTGMGTKHSISIEVGSKKVKVLGNFSYNSIKGVMKESKRDVINASMNVSYRTAKIQIKNFMGISSNHSEDSPYGSFSEYAYMNPYFRDKDKNGNITRYAEIAKMGGYTFEQKFINPLYNTTIGTSFTSSYLEFTDNLYVEATLLNGLKLISRLGVVAKRNKSDRFLPAKHTNFENYSEEDKFRKGSYTIDNGDMSDVNGDLYFNYNKTFGEHGVFVNVGANLGEKKYSEVFHNTEGFPSDKMNNILFAKAYAKDSKPQGEEQTKRDIGFLAVASYSYGNRFLSDLTLRRSASSQFGTNKKWGWFWSLGLGWNLHKEKFMQSIQGLSLLKLRASVGTTGNQNINNNSISSYKYYMDKNYDGFIGATLNGMANKDLGWERKRDYNVGFDLNWKLLSLKFDYYIALTDNLVTKISLPTSNGFAFVNDNLGKVQNDGIEIKMTVTPYRSKEGYLNFTFNLMTNHNKIIKISDALKKYNDDRRSDASSTQQSTPLPIYEEGKSMNGIWAVKSLGIDPSTGNELFLKRNGEKTYKWDAIDMICGGDKMPKFNGNVGVNGEYKGIGCSVVCRFLGGGQMYNETLVNKIENIDISNNIDKRVLYSRWTREGDNKKFKRLGLDRTQAMVGGTFPDEKTRATTRFIQDRNEFDIGSINFYYDFNKKLVRRLGLERMKFSVMMNDVYKWSSMGVERGTLYPFARSMSFKLNITF